QLLHVHYICFFQLVCLKKLLHEIIHIRVHQHEDTILYQFENTLLKISSDTFFNISSISRFCASVKLIVAEKGKFLVISVSKFFFSSSRFLNIICTVTFRLLLDAWFPEIPEVFTEKSVI